MPVDQAPARPAARKPDGAKVVRYHDFIDEKIESTRRMVKLVDLATALVELSVAILLFLLLAVVVEHWMIHGGYPVAVRAVLFCLLVASCGYFAVRRLWPLCVHAINPVYAAQTIENNSPTLKNGLINLLLFRQKRAEIPDAVYRTIEEHAAHGLTRTPLDTAVDRSELIRLGYVLIAVVAVLAGYKVFSPKDPFIAVERVLMPWADIVPASRVTIADIKPGVVTISRGEFLDISAEVRGLSDEESVVLRFTTDDGQIVARPVPLKRAVDGLRYSCRLADDPAASANTSAGITRNLTYWLEAGDARSLDYPVTVVPAATILVERVDYHFPAYTGYVDHSAEGVGDIHAIEGTRVTVHARANGPIREANIDFEADGRNDLRMTSAETKAQASFDLALRERDRDTPVHASYVLRFANDEGRENHNPVKHSINVEADLPPEAEIRAPQENSRDVRLDEQVTIELSARDPDFALGSVRVRGKSGGRDLLNELLLNAPQKSFTGKHTFTPKALGLQPGEVLEYWAEADDNRTPKPNTVATDHKSLRVVAPNPPPPPKNGDPARGAPASADGKQDQQPQRNDPQRNQQPGESAGGDANSADAKQAPGQQGGDAQPQPGNQRGQGQAQGQQSQNNQQLNQGQQNNGQGQGQGQQPNNGQQGNSGDQQQPSNAQQQNSANHHNENPQGGSKNAQQQNGESRGDSAGGEPASAGRNSRDNQNANNQTNNSTPNKQTAAQPDSQQGKQPTGESAGGAPASAGGKQGDAPQQPSESDTPVSSQGDNDAEAFNRIQKHMEQKGELKNEQENGSEGEGKKQNETANSNQQPPSHRDAKQNSPQNSQDPQPGESASANGKRGDNNAANATQQRQNADQQSGNQSQERNGENGANRRPDDVTKKPENTTKSGGESAGGESASADGKQQPLGSEQTSSPGAPGGGHEQSPQGSPNSQPGMQPKDKPKQAGSPGDKSKNEESSAGARGNRESDSHGDQGGDKAGGGEEGGGQKSPHDGTGSAGANQSADQGAGQSGEKGRGENSADAGGDANSKGRTGAGDGKTPGQGTDQRAGAGDKPGGNPNPNNDPSTRDATPRANDATKPEGESGRKGEGEKQKPSESTNGEPASAGGKRSDKLRGDDNKQPSDPTKPQSDPNKTQDDPPNRDAKPSDQQQQSPHQQKDQQQNSGDNKSTSDDNKGGAASGSNGAPGNASNPQPSITGDAPAGDAANLDYARKQTDMVLDKLADQLNKKKVDDGLLKDLGWTEADLKRFVDRWQQRKAAAEQNDEKGETAKRELDDALRSLGLRPGELQQNAAQKDTLRDLREGYRGPVPNAYKERLKAYNQGVSRARQNGE